MGRNKNPYNIVVLYPSDIKQLDATMQLGELIGNRDTSGPGLSDAITRYLDYIADRHSNQYVQAHANELRLFNEFVGPMPLGSIRRYHVKDFKDWRRHHSLVDHKPVISVRAVNFAVSVLSVFFNWAIDREIISGANPAARCKDPEDNFRHVVLYPEHIAELFDTARKKREWLYTGIMLALLAGLRKTEVLELRWGDIDLYHGVINLRAEMTKTKRQRAVPIPDLLEKHLVSIEHTGDWVLMDKGKKVLKNQFRYNWEHLRDALSFANLPNGLTLTFHDLRHIYAQSLRDAGINLGDIQAYLGHSSVELTVRRYAQRGGVDGRAKVNRLADVYKIR